MQNKLLFIICSLLIKTCLVAQNIELKRVFTNKDGLPQNRVSELCYDDYKNIWIGTQNGISKFNGYSFSNYPEMKGKEITTLFLDSKNNLWVGTKKGLYLLDRVSNTLMLLSSHFIRDITSYNQRIYFITPNHLFSVRKDNKISQIQISNNFNDLRKIAPFNNNLYIGLGNSHGLLEFNLSLGIAKQMKNDLQQSTINCLKVINKSLWIGTSEGRLYELSDNKLNRIPLDNNTHSIQDITKINSDIWVGTDGNGIFSIKGRTIYKHYFNFQNQKKEIGDNNILSILNTGNNGVWIGTNNSGISHFSKLDKQFSRITKKYKKATVYLNKPSTTCFEDNEKNLFFGTNFGLTKINPDTKDIVSINFKKSLEYIGGSKILSIFKSNNTNVWVGSYDGGLGRFDKSLKPIKKYYPFSKNLIKQQAINFISDYSKNEILINSMFKGLGIFNIDKEEIRKIPLISSDSILNYQNYSIREFNNIIYSYVLNQDVCWFDKHEKVLKPLFRPPAIINDLYRNNDGTFWLSTRGDGLYLVDNKGGVLTHLKTEDGLTSNFLLRIEKDDYENLWVSSISGLNKINTQNQVIAYNESNGLPSIEFKHFASHKLKDGRIVFGTLAGFIFVEPIKDYSITNQSKIIISDIKFQNESIKNLSKENFLKEPIENTSRIRLPFNRNSFSIHFYNTNYNFFNSSNFKYRLLGQEKNWIQTMGSNQVSYTNLSPGSYKFEILTKNKSIPNKNPTILYIDILSPWYWSIYSISIYVILLIFILYFIYNLISYKQRIIKEREFYRYKLKITNTINEEKIDFFTNIVHDIKTPLSLIIAPLNLLLKDSKISMINKENLSLIKKNTNRLLKLVDNILDFKTLDSNNKLKLEISKVKIETIFVNLKDSFHQACKEKEIELKIINNCKNTVYLDISKVERILWNLTSNAIDYGPKNTHVKIVCSIVSNSRLKLSIQDNGKGLDEVELNHLFEPSFKKEILKYNYYNANNGFGLGLSIVKKLVDIHRGNIEVYSKNKNGTTFIITLPYKKESYDSSEIKTDNTQKDNYTFTPIKINSSEKAQYKLCSIFIVEDNIELNAFLSNYLKPKFKIYSFLNGAEALKAAKKKVPDLIISDILMPVMDGYELCKKIKNNFLTSHIPFILLTAKSSEEHQLEGMRKGVDLYLVKPFNPDLLIASVNSILENRVILRKKYQQANLMLNDKSLNLKDKAFLDNLQKFAKENINVEKVSIRSISEELNCSKSVLTKKTKALTGLSPIAFINNYKLNKAYDLILKNGLSVSEAAFHVGYSDPNYFSISFKKKFGKNPSEVKNRK